MIAGVADTHTVLWHLFDDARLSLNAQRFIEHAARARQKIAVSSISIAELVYLIEKNRFPESVYFDVRRALADPNHVLEEVMLGGHVVEAMRQISRADVPDMPDRIVAATAYCLSVPVVSRDRRIRCSTVQSVW